MTSRNRRWRWQEPKPWLPGAGDCDGAKGMRKPCGTGIILHVDLGIIVQVYAYVKILQDVHLRLVHFIIYLPTVCILHRRKVKDVQNNKNSTE